MSAYYVQNKNSSSNDQKYLGKREWIVGKHVFLTLQAIHQYMPCIGKVKLSHP